MSKGVIKEYDRDRGCGVIVDPASGQSFIVYANYINLKQGESLIEGTEVEYDIEMNRNRSWAVNVRLV